MKKKKVALIAKVSLIALAVLFIGQVITYMLFSSDKMPSAILYSQLPTDLKYVVIPEKVEDRLSDKDLELIRSLCKKTYRSVDELPEEEKTYWMRDNKKELVGLKNGFIYKREISSGRKRGHILTFAIRGCMGGLNAIV